MGRLVEVDQVSLVGRRMGALPIVNSVFSRLGLVELLDDYVPMDPRASLAPSASLLVLVRSLVVERAPVYKITEWAAGRPDEVLGLEAGEARTLNDDRLGRALDDLFEADRASMLTRLMTSVIKTFSISTDELHNDATTLSMQGDYSSFTGASPFAPRVLFGHAKERPDLAQLLFLFTVSSDGYVPITYRLADGNTAEDKTHIGTWTECCTLAQGTMFLYVSDSKLCNRQAMGHIDKHHGRFLTIMPRTRAEDGEFRRYIAKDTVEWTEVMRRPGAKKDDPDEVFFATPAPSPSAEGYRIVWFRSSDKEMRDALDRQHRIEKARVAIGQLDERLQGPRSRLKDEKAVTAAAQAAIEEAKASRWVSARVSTTTIVEHPQQKRGRPGPNTVYLRIEKTRYSVRAVIADDVVRDDAACDGCWPAMTNDKDMSHAELLEAMKRQPGVENRHHVLKGVVDFVPVYLKSNERIDAFAFLAYIAVLVHALIERELRRAMSDAEIAALPLYPEDRACKAPTAARVIEIFEPLCAHELLDGDQVVKMFEPNLSKLHRQILGLLNVAASAYRPG